MEEEERDSDGVNEECTYRNNKDDDEHNYESHADTTEDDARIKQQQQQQQELILQRLDSELKVLRTMKVSFAAMLALLEAARDDLQTMHAHADRLERASVTCRTMLSTAKEQQQQSETK